MASARSGPNRSCTRARARGDASGSVSDDRFELQKQGYAAAFRNRQVLNSIRSLMTQRIAVTMMQWTGPELHVQTVDWTLVKDEVTVNALADAIEASKRWNYRTYGRLRGQHMQSSRRTRSGMKPLAARPARAYCRASLRGRRLLGLHLASNVRPRTHRNPSIQQRTQRSSSQDAKISPSSIRKGPA